MRRFHLLILDATARLRVHSLPPFLSPSCVPCALLCSVSVWETARREMRVHIRYKVVLPYLCGSLVVRYTLTTVYFIVNLVRSPFGIWKVSNFGLCERLLNILANIFSRKIYEVPEATHTDTPHTTP